MAETTPRTSKELAAEARQSFSDFLSLLRECEQGGIRCDVTLERHEYTPIGGRIRTGFWQGHIEVFKKL